MSNPHVSVRAAGLILAMAQPACDTAATAPHDWQRYEGPMVYVGGAPAFTTTQRLVLPIDAITPEGICPGESVHVTGEIKVTFHLTTNREVDPQTASQILVDNEAVALDGIGLASGRAYQFRGVLNSIIESENPSQVFPAAAEYVAESVVTSPGLGAVAIGRSRVFIVLDANGNLVVQRVLVEFRCPLR